MEGLRPQPTCSFCGKAKAEVRRLFAGPMVFICDQCVVAAERLAAGEDVESHLARVNVQTAEVNAFGHRRPRCRFCDKSCDTVAATITSPLSERAVICNECLALCRSMVAGGGE